jgi:hypothetical protein
MENTKTVLTWFSLGRLTSLLRKLGLRPDEVPELPGEIHVYIACFLPMRDAFRFLLRTRSGVPNELVIRYQHSVIQTDFIDPWKSFMKHADRRYPAWPRSRQRLGIKNAEFEILVMNAIKEAGDDHPTSPLLERFLKGEPEVIEFCRWLCWNLGPKTESQERSHYNELLPAITGITHYDWPIIRYYYRSICRVMMTTLNMVLSDIPPFFFDFDYPLRYVMSDGTTVYQKVIKHGKLDFHFEHMVSDNPGRTHHWQKHMDTFDGSNDKWLVSFYNFITAIYTEVDPGLTVYFPIKPVEQLLDPEDYMENPTEDMDEKMFVFSSIRMSLKYGMQMCFVGISVSDGDTIETYQPPLLTSQLGWDIFNMTMSALCSLDETW